MKTRPGIWNYIRNASTLLSRSALAKNLLDPRRDIDEECGHPENLSTEDFTAAFTRGDLSSRIIKLYPEECWSENPEVFENEDPEETKFERTWKVLEKRLRLYAALQRADVLSGIGRFGILLLGFNDGGRLSDPVPGINEAGESVGGQNLELLYVRPFDEALLTVKSLEANTANPRYGLPLMYDVSFTDTALGVIGTTKQVTTPSPVHWSRVIHLADNRMSSDVFGLPRLEVVFNRLLDIKKIAGGSGEMFWKGGFPGISLETDPGDNDIELDKESAKQQMEDYMNGLQRYIALVGMQAKSLAPQVASPKDHLESQIRLIAMSLSVPWRILMGVEVGQLASEQDIRSWNRRLNRRRHEYLTPFVISPLIDRLLAVGVLPPVAEEGYQVNWSDLNSPSDTDKATVAEQRTNAVAKYVQAGADVLIPPFHFLTLVLGLPDDRARSILEEVDKDLEFERDLDHRSRELDVDLKEKALNASPSRPANLR